MKIKLERDCAIAGQHCAKGEVVDVSTLDGKYLVNVGIAKAADKDAKVKKQNIKKTKILMTRSCMVAGAHRAVGDVVLAVAADAAFLLAHGHALADGSDKAKAFKAELKKIAAKQAAAEQDAAKQEAAEHEDAKQEVVDGNVVHEEPADGEG